MKVYLLTCDDAAGRRVACAKSGTAFEQSDSVNYGYNARSAGAGEGQTPHSTLSPGGTMRLCPTKEGFAFNAGIFVRGTMGVGLGVEVDGRIDLVALLWRKESLLDGLNI